MPVPNKKRHNKIEVHVKRLGGGFGGKETRACLYQISVTQARSITPIFSDYGCPLRGFQPFVQKFRFKT
jgi:hypothetical protein